MTSGPPGGLESRDIDGIDGVKIRTRVSGDGPSLLLIHGYPQCGTMWYRFAPALAATIDLEHDEADFEKKVQSPALVLSGDAGLMHKTYDVLATWRDKCEIVSGRALPSWHFLPEEAPEETLREIEAFMNQG